MADNIIITDSGLGIINNRLKNGDTGATEPKYAHWGTGTTPPVGANTTLETPATETRVQGTTSLETTTTTNDTYQSVSIITCNATPKTITEYGQFDASSNGNIFIRGTFTGIGVSTGDSIQFTSKAIGDQA